ncbi:hypothetical protein LT875_002479 [Salmonella enterica]|nr:hypothetical protein [Salmonella enterica]
MDSLLTVEAAQAIEWMRQRMPDGIFDMFQAELEAAMGPVVAKFGFDKELTDAFRVSKLVADREPLIVGDDGKTTLRADIYSGGGTYAITRKGDIYCKMPAGGWRKSRLSKEEVISRSITRVSGTIKVKGNQ